MRIRDWSSDVCSSDLAMAAGVNFVDTADTYAKGASERITGELIRARRNELVLATKVANPNGPGPNQRGLSRKWIMEEAEASIDRKSGGEGTSGSGRGSSGGRRRLKKQENKKQK